MSILFYLVNDDIYLLCETKKISNESLAMKDLGDTSFVSSFRYLDITQNFLQISQKIYINKVENKLTY